MTGTGRTRRLGETPTPPQIDPEKLKSFTNAFIDAGRGSDWLECACGKTYYNTSEVHHYDGDREELEKEGVGVDHALTLVSFGGRHYVHVCTCWHRRALKTMERIDAHAAGIALYLRAEKARKKRIAEEAPVV